MFTAILFITCILVVISNLTKLFKNEVKDYKENNKEQIDNKIKYEREKEIINKREYEIKREIENKRKEENLKVEILNKLGLNKKSISSFDREIIVKSRQALDNYDDIKFFKENKETFEDIEKIILEKKKIIEILKYFIKNGSELYNKNSHYNSVVKEFEKFINKNVAFIIRVNYISASGNNLGTKDIMVTQNDINRYKKDVSLFMTKAEYNKLMKEKEKRELLEKQKEYYDILNSIIDYANINKDFLIIKGSREKIDSIISQLFDKTINNIKKIKTINSEEWKITKDYMSSFRCDIEKIVNENHQILNYYESDNFIKIKKTCEILMNSQKEFNEYINEKIQSISKLFGTRVVRNETIVTDEYNYIRPYKKTITPFTAEVSSSVFSSAENNPLEYVIKYFYPNKNLYQDQIQKLYYLIEELETLKETKQIIENYKKEYQQYLKDVPEFVIKNDENGFYSRLGFATIDESVLEVEYKFSYTSNGGMVQRSFTVPMTEETIIKLIKILESKLTIKAFIKEQRILMTKKLREFIKKRDNFTCCNCGNSIHNEPNLLLEIDHIIPVSKGGETIENNLQTLCWKCNRAKSNKITN